jgi:hypothetical protein
MGGNINNNYGSPYGVPQLQTGRPAYSVPQTGQPVAQAKLPQTPNDQFTNSFYNTPNGQFLLSVDNQTKGVCGNNTAFIQSCLATDAKWKQQQAMAQGAAPAGTQQPTTGTQQPVNGAQQPTTGTQQQSAADVTKWDYSDPGKFASNPSVMQTMNDPSVPQGEKDYAALQLLMYKKDGNISTDDIQKMIDNVSKANNKGLTDALVHIKDKMKEGNGLGYADNGKDDADKMDVKGYKAVAKKILDSKFQTDLDDVVQQLQKDKKQLAD